MDIITQDLLILSVFLLWTTGLTDGNDVNQTPLFWKNKGQSAEMHCNHTKGINYSQMYWYRQLPGETMKLVVFTRFGNNAHDFGDFSKEKFSATKPDAESGTFTVKNLEPGDTGLYFCAVRTGYSQPAYFGQGTKLTVLEHEVIPLKEENLEVLGPSSKECRNLKDNQKRKKTLLCMATDFYPDHVHMFWQLNGKNVTIGVATGTPVKKGKVYSITSRLRVPADDWSNPKNNFTCIVNFFDGSKNNISQKSIFGVVDGKNYMTKGRYLKTTQNAKLSYSIFIIKSSIYGAFVAFLVWKLQGKKN